jgi:hypothetical protein
MQFDEGIGGGRENSAGDFRLPSLRCGVFEEKLTAENVGPTKPVSSQKSLTEVSEQRPVAADGHRAAR